MLELRDEGYTVTKICEIYNISRTTYYKWHHRSLAGEPMINGYRRPHRSPNMIGSKRSKLVIKERERTGYGPARIAAILRMRGVKISASGVYAVLKRAGMNKKAPKEKKPVIRYERKTPFDLVHLDVKYLSRLDNSKRRAYQFSAIDDCVRMGFAMIFDSKTSRNAVIFLLKMIEFFGCVPTSIMTDNGAEFTNIKGHRGDRANHKFEKALDGLDIKHIYTKIRRPQTNGKVERFHRIVDEELYDVKHFINEAHRERSLERFISFYNNKRPHMGINGMTPQGKLDKLNGKKVIFPAA